jgi:hypothetical protein
MELALPCVDSMIITTSLVQNSTIALQRAELVILAHSFICALTVMFIRDCGSEIARLTIKHSLTGVQLFREEFIIMQTTRVKPLSVALEALFIGIAL